MPAASYIRELGPLSAKGRKKYQTISPPYFNRVSNLEPL
jgi:hypothetical protein